MRVLITGGDGFIGRHVAKCLREERYHCCVWDLPDHDITNVSSLRGFEAIIHLAAATGMTTTAWSAIRTNIQGTQRLIDAAKDAGIKRIVAASTAGALITEPMTPYGVSKLTMEGLLRSSGISQCSLRLTNVYGPGCQTKKNLIPNAIQAGLKGYSLPVTGGGTQLRDFVYVTDVARAFRSALKSETQGVITIGSGVTMEVNDALNEIEKHVGPIHRYRVPEREGEPKVVWADLSQAEYALGWLPKVPFEEGIERTVNDFRSGLC